MDTKSTHREDIALFRALNVSSILSSESQASGSVRTAIHGPSLRLRLRSKNVMSPSLCRSFVVAAQRPVVIADGKACHPKHTTTRLLRRNKVAYSIIDFALDCSLFARCCHALFDFSISRARVARLRARLARWHVGTLALMTFRLAVWQCSVRRTSSEKVIGAARWHFNQSRNQLRSLYDPKDERIMMYL